MPTCRYCHHEPFPDWRTLCVHIVNSPKGHRGGKKFASNYLLKNVLLKEETKERVALTDAEKAAKKSSFREVSGETKTVSAICPNPKCTHKFHMASVDAEYADSPFAWKINGRLAVMCQGCGGKQ